MSDPIDPVEQNLLRQVHAGLQWAEQQELILPDHRFSPAGRRFVFRPNAYGLQWVVGRHFAEARAVFGQPFGGLIDPEGHDYAFVVLGAPPLSPNIRGAFVCLRPPRRDARSAPRLGLMIEKLVLAYSLYRAEWSPPFNAAVARWLWEHRKQWVPVPQPDIPWVRRWDRSRPGNDGR